MECERKNDRCKNEAVLEKKLQRESRSWCGFQANHERSKRRKRTPHSTEPQIGRSERFPGGSGRDGTNTKEHHGDKIRRHLQVKDGGEKTRNSR